MGMPPKSAPPGDGVDPAPPAGPTRAAFLSWWPNRAEPVKLVTYTGLGSRKALITQACARLSLSVSLRKLFIAMAMIESTDLASRDKGKDGNPMSKNYSMFNLNGYMMWKMRCVPPTRYFMGAPFLRDDVFSAFEDERRSLSPAHLTNVRIHEFKRPSFLTKESKYENRAPMLYFYVFNRDDCLTDLMFYMSRYLAEVGSEKFLFFVRAGGTGFEQLQKTVKYEWKIYMAGLATALDIVDTQELLLSDDRRIEIPIPHIDDTGVIDPKIPRATYKSI